MNNFGMRQLVCAIILQAVKDYCTKNASDKKKSAILMDLRSPYMDQISNGTSVIVAEQLELRPNEIAKRLKVYKE